MGCAVGTVKFAVFAFNFLLVLLGFGMVLFGALDSPLPEGLDQIKEFAAEVSITSKVLMIAGAVIFVVAFFGCWGAVSDSSCLLLLYAVFLMVLILVELAVGIFIYMNRESSEKAAAKYLKDWISEYDKSENAKSIIDQIQKKVQCCGVDSMSDWDTRASLPLSCCEDKSISSCPKDKAFSQPCLHKGVRLVVEKVKRYMWYVAGIIAVEIFTILFALIVRNSILNDRRRSLA